MPETIAVAPVRKQVLVNTDPARAFEVFTKGMDRWWPARHSINRNSALQTIIIEPVVGGRWMERGEDGSECQWGKVLSWEPPSRLVLAWQITPEFQFDPELTTELEIRFTPNGDSTLVELEHRLEGYGDAADQMRELFDGSQAWEGSLAAFARFIDAGL